MGKKTRITLLILGFAVIAFNAYTLDFSEPWSDTSQVSWIGIVAGLCAILLVWVNYLSGRVQDTIRVKKKQPPLPNTATEHLEEGTANGS